MPLLEQAAEAEPNEPTFRYHYAIGLAQSGDMAAAFPQFRHVLGEAEAHYNIGYLLYEQGQTEMAKARFEKALAINPQLQQAQNLLAEIDGKLRGPRSTGLAQAPRPFPPREASPLRPVATVSGDRGTSHIRLAHSEKPAPWAAIKPSAQPTAQVPAYRNLIHAEVAEAPQPVTSPVSRPAAAPIKFSATPPEMSPVDPPTEAIPDAPATEPVIAPAEPAAVPAAPQQGWKASQPAKEPDGGFFEPEASEAQAPPATTPTGSVLTPPITPAQREQWENQMKMSAPQ